MDDIICSVTKPKDEASSYNGSKIGRIARDEVFNNEVFVT